VLLPAFVIGGLIASYAGTAVVGESGISLVIGWALALPFGFAATTAIVTLIYRLFPGRRFRWVQTLRAAAPVAAGISVLSLLFVVPQPGSQFPSALCDQRHRLRRAPGPVAVPVEHDAPGRLRAQPGPVEHQRSQREPAASCEALIPRIAFIVVTWTGGLTGSNEVAELIIVTG
jgi:hypothetical protein